MGDQTMRQAPPVLGGALRRAAFHRAQPRFCNHAPLPNAVVRFRVIDPIKSVDGGGELHGCHLTDRSTTLRSLLGRIRGINRKGLTSGHICM
jgi:hypothetical protein